MTPTYLTQPFLQNVKTDGMTVMFELDSTVTCTVEYGTTASYGDSVACTSQSSGFSSTIYKAVITGLAAFTNHHYRVIANGTAGPDKTFRTAPPTSIDFSFGAWSDSQGGNRGAYPPDFQEPTKSMMAHMAVDPDIHFGANSGDLAENGSSYSDTRDYYLDRVAEFLGQTKPWFSAWGNHEPGSGAVLRKFADMPSKDRGAPFHAGFGSYSFDYAGCHFVMLDDNTIYSEGTYGELAWLEGDLKSPANQNARFTFLFVHRPPYCEVWIDGNGYLRNNLVVCHTLICG